MEVTLERVDGQTSMERIKQIPRPSQLDDWHFYERLEAEKIQQREGAIAYSEWARKKETQKAERDR